MTKKVANIRDKLTSRITTEDPDAKPPLERRAAADREPPAGHDWVVKGTIRAKAVGLIIGSSGDGKTAHGVDIACHVACGIDWRGCKVRGGPVVIIEAEDADDCEAMLSAWEQKHLPEDQEHANVDVIAEHDLDLAKDLDRVIEAVQAIAEDYGEPVRLVEIDTLATVWRGGEDNEAFALLVRECRKLADATGAAVLIVHHVGKDKSRGARGGSSLHAAADFVMETERLAEFGVLDVKKIRGARPFKVGYDLEVVDFGKDRDGDPVTSVVVTQQEVAQRNVKLTDVERKALQVLVTLRTVKDGAAIQEREWRDATDRHLPGHSNTRVRWKRISEGLMTKGYVHYSDGIVAIAPDAIIPHELSQRINLFPYVVNLHPEE